MLHPSHIAEPLSPPGAIIADPDFVTEDWDDEDERAERSESKIQANNLGGKIKRREKSSSPRARKGKGSPIPALALRAVDDLLDDLSTIKLDSERKEEDSLHSNTTKPLRRAPPLTEPRLPSFKPPPPNIPYSRSQEQAGSASEKIRLQLYSLRQMQKDSASIDTKLERLESKLKPFSDINSSDFDLDTLAIARAAREKLSPKTKSKNDHSLNDGGHACIEEARDAADTLLEQQRQEQQEEEESKDDKSDDEKEGAGGETHIPIVDGWVKSDAKSTEDGLLVPESEAKSADSLSLAGHCSPEISVSQQSMQASAFLSPHEDILDIEAHSKSKQVLSARESDAQSSEKAKFSQDGDPKQMFERTVEMNDALLNIPRIGNQELDVLLSHADVQKNSAFGPARELVIDAELAEQQYNLEREQAQSRGDDQHNQVTADQYMAEEEQPTYQALAEPGFEDWVVAYDDAGQRYFYCHATGASQWEDPRGDDYLVEDGEDLQPNENWLDQWHRRADEHAATVAQASVVHSAGTVHQSTESIASSSPRWAHSDVARFEQRGFINSDNGTRNMRLPVGRAQANLYATSQAKTPREIELEQALREQQERAQWLEHQAFYAKQAEKAATMRAHATARAQHDNASRVREEERQKSLLEFSSWAGVPPPNGQL